MSKSRSLTRALVPAVAAVAVAGALVAAPAAFADSPLPPLGSTLDVNGNGILDSSETPDNPDNPDDVNGNGVLDSSETPDNPDLP